MWEENPRQTNTLRKTHVIRNGLKIQSVSRLRFRVGFEPRVQRGERQRKVHVHTVHVHITMPTRCLNVMNNDTVQLNCGQFHGNWDTTLKYKVCRCDNLRFLLHSVRVYGEGNKSTSFT